MQYPQDQNSPFADVMDEFTQVQSHVLVSDPYAVLTESEGRIMVKCLSEETICGRIVPQASYNHTVFDVRIQGSTQGEHGGPPSDNSRVRALTTLIPNDQESSEDDKGLVNFLKKVGTLAVAVIAFNLAAFTRVFYSTIYPATNKLQECILAGLAALLPFSVITVGVVHCLGGRANAIDLATTMVIAVITYGFFAFCLAAMFIAKAPWFTVVPLFLVAWSVLTGWLLWRYRRARGIFVMLKKVFKFKMHGQ